MAAQIATITLVADTAQSPTITGGGEYWELTHHATTTDVAYYRVDGTTAVKAADENGVLLPNERIRVKATGANGVSVISAGANLITVERL